MFRTLPESRVAARKPSRGWTVASAALHAGVIALGAVRAPADDAALEVPRSFEPLQWIIPAGPISSAPQSPTPTGKNLAAPAAVTVQLPVVPTIDVALPFDGLALSTTEIFGNPPPLARGGRDALSAPGTIHTVEAVDRQVVPRSGNGQPRYPAALRAATLDGGVVVRFVVDTTGYVEPGSIVIRGASHPLFADAVRRWLPQTRYAPAESGGRRVRQLVEQRIEFALRR